jgi:ABC-type nitrate/sulfonate/bicarbonate transport system substrate-binding protein
MVINPKDAKNPPEISRRRFITVAGAGIAGGLFMVACGDDADPTTTTAAPGTTAPPATDAPMTAPQSSLSVVNFDFNTPNISLQAPYWIGQTKGFFEEVGIERLNITSNDDWVPPMAAGSLDVALADATVLFGGEDASVQVGDPIGMRMTCIALGAQPLVMIANEGITKDNIAGKVVGGAREGTTNEALAKFLLGEIGIDWETDVDFRNLTGGSNDWVTAMLSGQVDATIAFPRHIALAEEAGGGALFVGSRPDPQAGFGVTQETMEEHPDFVAAWCYAYIKSQQWVKDEANWEEAREIIVNEHGLDYPDNTFNVLNIDAGIMTSDLGFNPDAMDGWMEFMTPLDDALYEGLPWREYTDVSGLHVAQEALGLPTNPSLDLTSGETKGIADL